MPRWALIRNASLGCVLTLTGPAFAEPKDPAPPGGATWTNEAPTPSAEPRPSPEPAAEPGTSEPVPPPAGEEAEALPPVYEAPPPVTETPLEWHATVADALAEAALDLGIEALVVPAAELDGALDDRPEGVWILGFSVRASERDVRLEVAAVPPDSTVRRVTVEEVPESRLSLRAMVLLRDAVRIDGGSPAPAPIAPAVTEGTEHHSSGRAVLALNAAVLGGYVGVSLHQASDSADDRLLYPLAALGVGLGLGSSMLIADEWEISSTDAWFLSAGMVWPLSAGVLIAAGRDVEPEQRYLYGLSGAAVGISLATVAVAQGDMPEGSAAVAHSGGAFGLSLGALAEGIIQGNLEEAPLQGMGYGAGLGVVGAGIFATGLDLAPPRVLMVDLAALLGGLTGGAVATPLLLVDEPDDGRRRLWFGAVGLGTLLGAGAGLVATREAVPSAKANSTLQGVVPFGGIIGQSRRGTETAPAWGVGVSGLW